VNLIGKGLKATVIGSGWKAIWCRLKPTIFGSSD
jgi:hypothetical protein